MGVGAVCYHIRRLNLLRYFCFFYDRLYGYETEIIPHKVRIDFRTHLWYLCWSQGCGIHFGLTTINERTSSVIILSRHFVATA